MKARWALAGWLVVTLGCMPQMQTARSQKEDEPEGQVRCLGDICSFANAEPVAVWGIGLVGGLDGTGSAAPPGQYRSIMERQLKQLGVENVSEFLTSPNYSVVLVRALVPAGTRKGDRIDVKVALPPGSKTTSLSGGYLYECPLYNYDTLHSSRPDLAGVDITKRGSKILKAEGPLLVGLRGPNADGTKPDEAQVLKSGTIWGGGRALKERQFMLVMNEDHQFSRVAELVANRISESFQGPQQGRDAVAEAKSKQLIVLRVPPQYKHNMPRFLRVVKFIPLDGAPPADSPYRGRLQRDLLEPARTIEAALRLEALGPESAPVLKVALQSSYPLVRFAAAEALAYLNQPSCGEELAQLAVEQPRLRAYCLAGLAALDQAVSYVKLKEMLANPTPDVRYGAFRALQAHDERDPVLNGEQVAEGFWLHRVALAGPPMVHLAGSRRAEIVLFGDPPRLVPPFTLLVGGNYTIKADAGATTCTVSRFSVSKGHKSHSCSLDVADVVRTLAHLGGTYSDAADLLSKASDGGNLSCPLAVEALPKIADVVELAKTGRDDPTLRSETNANDLGATPTLFEGAGTK